MTISNRVTAMIAGRASEPQEGTWHGHSAQAEDGPALGAGMRAMSIKFVVVMGVTFSIKGRSLCENRCRNSCFRAALPQARRFQPMLDAGDLATLKDGVCRWVGR